MSLKDKMANAKEVDLFEELTQEEKIEAIVEGRLQVAMIEELEQIKAEIMATGNWKSEYEISDRGVIKTIGSIDNHIAELKGENK